MTIKRSEKLNKVFQDSDCSSEEGSKSFTGTSSYNEAVEIFKTGYKEPLARIKKGMAGNATTSAPRNRPVTGVVGFTPCVPNAIMGLPNSMISVEKIQVKSKLVTILYSPSVSSSYTVNQIIDAGVTVLNIVNDLELKGYRVKLEVEIIGTREGTEFASVIVKLKDWREHLDLQKLAFPLVHPSALRRIGFKWLETVPALSNSGYTRGYGYPIGNDPYNKARSFYKTNKLLQDETFYLNVPMILKTKCNKEEVMKNCGLQK